jgi:hypothetical protein
MKNSYLIFTSTVALSFALFGCRPILTEQTELAAKGDSLFKPSEIAKVSVSMQANDFENMKEEGRDISEKINECRSDVETEPYRKYKTSGVRFNGSEFAGASLTKKGYMGSLSAAKPSFKLKDVSKNIEEIVLNSDRQDPSHIKQCLAYFFFKKAGIPTPKCQVAEVTINAGGSASNLGLYTMVESPKEAYKEIAGLPGILVEGTHADFSASGKTRFELKNGQPERDQPKVSKLIDELTILLKSAPSKEGYVRLSEIIDLKSFYKYWATETMIGHWDGYANNMNNFMFFIPVDNGSLGKIVFLPWGTDGTFVNMDIINRNVKNRLFHVSASAALPNWLIKYEPSRVEYLTTLKGLLGTVWGPEVLEEFQRLKVLTSKSTVNRDSEYGKVIARVQDYLQNQKKVLESELGNTSSSAYSSIETGTINCWTPIAEISGTIEAPRANSPFAFSPALMAGSSLSLALITETGKTETPVTLTGTALAMRQVLENRDVSLSIEFSAGAFPNTRLSFSTITEPALFSRENRPIRHLGYANTGALQVQVNPGAGEAGWMELGLIGGGSITILEGAIKPAEGVFQLPEKAKIAFSGKIYSKYPLSTIMKKIGK